MGNWYTTSFAIMDDGSRITTYDARELMKSQSLKGSLRHVITGKPVKFVPCKEREDYFAVLNHKDIAEEERRVYKESPLHKMAKEMFLNLKGSFVLGGVPYHTDKLVSIEIEQAITGVSKDANEILIPDITLTFENCVYFVEIFYRHKLSLEKLNKYKYFQNTHNQTCYVLEIDISDMDVEKPFREVEAELMNRLFVRSGNTFNMETWKGNDNITSLFGTCYYCGSGLRLRNNIADPLSSGKGGLKDKIPNIHVVDKQREVNDDKTSLGSALLVCPRCIEGRYTQLLCPECLHKGLFTPLDLLYNEKAGAKRPQFILKCKKYVAKLDEELGDTKDTCSFCINVLEADGVTVTDELAMVGGFSGMYKHWGKSRKKLLNYRGAMKGNN